MTLDQLFVEAGGYLDQLIDARRSAGDAAPSAELRPRSRSWGRMAAAVVAMAGIVGLVMVIGGHQERPSSPDVTRPHLGAPSVFDTGADIAVFINPAATAEQVGLDMSETARAVGAVGKVVQIEYLPADKAVNEARRVMGFDPPDPPGISPAFTPTLLRVWVSLDTGGSVPDLAKSLMALPNVLAVWTSDMQVTGQYPLCCYGGAPATTLAPLTTDPGSTEVAPAVNSAIQAHLVPLLTGLTQLGFDQSEYTTNPDGITTVSAWKADRSQTITVTITPGTPPTSENHTRPSVTVLDQTAERLAVAYTSNTGWKFTLIAQRTSGTTPLPSYATIQNLLYTTDP